MSAHCTASSSTLPRASLPPRSPAAAALVPAAVLVAPLAALVLATLVAPRCSASSGPGGPVLCLVAELHAVRLVVAQVALVHLPHVTHKSESAAAVRLRCLHWHWHCC